MTTVLCWNCEDKGAQLVGRMARLRPDVIVLPEACKPNDLVSRHQLERGLAAVGYDVTAIDYNDTDRRADDHVLVVGVRQESHIAVEAISLDTRRAAKLTWPDGLVVFGIHLDDRQERRRSGQFERLMQHVQRYDRAVIVGDLNAAPSGTGLSKVVAPAAHLWRRFHRPIGEPGLPQSRQARVGSLLIRLDEMLRSTVLSSARHHGFCDADRKARPTKRFPGWPWPVVQLDHALVRGLSALSYPLNEKGSDHLPIWVEM